MNMPLTWIVLTALATATACSLAGVFLVLRRMALVSDAISHSILLGIVGAFLITHDLASPLLIIAAAATGVLTVWLIELAYRTGLVASDAAVGLVFPALFAIAVILVNMGAGGVHLDTHMVLLGELAFTPLDTLAIAGLTLPKSLWVMGGISLLNLIFIVALFKELKLSTFDAGLAAALGFAPALLHYALVSLVSITAVGAFDTAGSVLVVALMVAPAASAYLLTNRLPVMLGLSVALGWTGCLMGIAVARWLNVPYAGAIAAMFGVVFLLTFLLAPEQGLLAQWRRKRSQRWEFARGVLLVHLLTHEGEPGEEHEATLAHVIDLLRWPPRFAGRVLHSAQQRELLTETGGELALTSAGRDVAQRLLTH